MFIQATEGYGRLGWLFPKIEESRDPKRHTPEVSDAGHRASISTVKKAEKTRVARRPSSKRKVLVRVTQRYSLILTDRTTKFQKMTVRMDPDGPGFPKSRTTDEDENDYDKEQNDKGGRQKGAIKSA